MVWSQSGHSSRLRFAKGIAEFRCKPRPEVYVVPYVGPMRLRSDERIWCPVRARPGPQPAGIASDGIEAVEHDVYRYPAGVPSDAHHARNGPNGEDSSGGYFRCAEGADASSRGHDDFETACGVG